MCSNRRKQAGIQASTACEAESAVHKNGRPANSTAGTSSGIGSHGANHHKAPAVRSNPVLIHAAARDSASDGPAASDFE